MSLSIQPQRDRHWLVYRLSIETQVRQGAAGKAITDYMGALDYVQTQLSPTLIFERGASLSSLYNPNPKSQKTIVTVDFASLGQTTIVEIQMRVNCMGNRPLSKDYDFWAAELYGIEQVLTGDYVDPVTSDFAAERAQWYNVAVMLTVLVVTLVVLMSATVAAMVYALYMVP